MSDDEDYFAYGTPLENEEGSKGQHARRTQEAAQTRALPVWQQVQSLYSTLPYSLSISSAAGCMAHCCLTTYLLPGLMLLHLCAAFQYAQTERSYTQHMTAWHA